MKIWLPAAIRFGIPYETFWHLNPKIMSIYQDVKIEQIKEQQQIINYTAWLQGRYYLSALGSALSKKEHYPQEPYNFTPSKKALTGEEGFLLWIDEFNRRFEKQGHVP